MNGLEKANKESVTSHKTSGVGNKRSYTEK